jgi:hypothetical protein
MATTSETLDKAQQLAVEARIRTGMMVSDYRRSNITRLRRAKIAAERCARLAAELASMAFEAADLLDAELRQARNRYEE